MKRYHYLIIILVVVVLAAAAFLVFGQKAAAPSVGVNTPSSTPVAATSTNPAGGSMVTSSSLQLGGFFSEHQSAVLGPYLADAKGRTLYVYNKDTMNVSNCTGACLSIWPPYGPGLTAAGTVNLPMLPANVSTIKGNNGLVQFTWKGMPLYYFTSDKNPGDVIGQGVGGFSVVKL